MSRSALDDELDELFARHRTEIVGLKTELEEARAQIAEWRGHHDLKDHRCFELAQRLEEARAQIAAKDDELADMHETLQQIVQWCDAYPLDIFPEPDLKAARKLLQAGGIAMGAVAASNIRHVLNGVRALAAPARETE
jgi:hypothetical protein